MIVMSPARQVSSRGQCSPRLRTTWSEARDSVLESEAFREDPAAP